MLCLPTGVTIAMIAFNDLLNADLVVDQIYEGGNAGNAGDDPISKLMGTGNQGGFRIRGSGRDKRFIVLYTSGENNDWPDHLNLGTGAFVYFGDNKTSGNDLHAKKGNKILRSAFASLHASSSPRENICPFFIFKKNPTQNSARSVKFLGLAAPGSLGITSISDLVAIWKTTESERFQNYKASFTILNEATIRREWLDELVTGREQYFIPKCWKKWLQSGVYQPLITEPTNVERSREMQLPTNSKDWAILKTVWEYFSDHPYDFEHFAAAIFSMQDSRAIIDEVTPPAPRIKIFFPCKAVGIMLSFGFGKSSRIVRAKPASSVLYPTTLFLTLKRVFTDSVFLAIESSSSKKGIINFLNGTVTFTPTISSSLISLTIFFRSFSSTFLFS